MPLAVAAVRSAEGLTFYNEATYDPVLGPGVRRAGDGWAGYTVAGDYAVHVRAADEELARRMLESAR